MAFATAQFLLPNQLSSGGFAGISTILYYLFKFPLGITILVLNIPLFVISFFRRGKGFFVKTIIGTVFLAIFLDLFEKFNPLTNDRFLACIYGGILIGIGTAINMKAQASTGGTELLTHIIRTYKSEYRTSNLIVILDTAVVLLNVLFFKTIEIGLYSAITIYIMGKMIDLFFEGVNFSKMIYIISPKFQEISDIINEDIRRGTTGIYAKGMYKNEEKMLLLCIASRNEVIKIIQIAKKIDTNAFIIILNAREVFGKGFKKKELNK